MGNCLVTQLKAVVDNPNLPILETMQQFTLDAIAASGNSTMTDTQKWALNHFFYKIGAISNSGIFAKLDILGLPFMAVSLDTALHNYTENGVVPTSISANADFANGAIISKLSSGVVEVCRYSGISGKTNKSFQFAAGAQIYSTKVIGTTRTYSLKYDSSANRASLYVSPYTEYGTVAIQNFSDFTPSIVAFNTKNENNENSVKVCYADSSDTYIKTPSVLRLSELTEENLSSYGILADSNSQIRGFAHGNDITDDEALDFIMKYRELMSAF